MSRWWRREARQPSPTSTRRHGCSVPITLQHRAHHPSTVPKGTPSLRAPSRAASLGVSLTRHLAGCSLPLWPRLRRLRGRTLSPPAPPGVRRSPSAPLAQVTGKGRAPPRRGPAWHCGSPCPFYHPCVTPGTFSITGLGGSGPCHRATSTEDELSPAPIITATIPPPPRAHPTAPQAWDEPRGWECPQLHGDTEGTGAAACQRWHHGPRVRLCPCRHPSGLVTVFVLLLIVPFLVTRQAGKPETLLPCRERGRRCRLPANGHPEPRHPHGRPAETQRHELALPGLDAPAPGLSPALSPAPGGTCSPPCSLPSLGTQREETASAPPWRFGHWKDFIGVGGIAESAGPSAQGSRCSGGGAAPSRAPGGGCM